MLLSWHNFFFASFDPGGLVSVDKPPLALWVETASAKLFGFSSASILLPEALAGVASVGLLYLLVQRYFGRVAGLVAALALAVSPVSVAVDRDNNPDALFVLLLVAAAYVGARAIESGRLRTLLARGGPDGARLRGEDARRGDHRAGHRARVPRLHARAVAARGSSTPPSRRASSSPCRAPGSRPFS